VTEHLVGKQGQPRAACNAPEWLEGVEPGSIPSQISVKGCQWRQGNPAKDSCVPEAFCRWADSWVAASMAVACEFVLGSCGLGPCYSVVIAVLSIMLQCYSFNSSVVFLMSVVQLWFCRFSFFCCVFSSFLFPTIVKQNCSFLIKWCQIQGHLILWSRAVQNTLWLTPQEGMTKNTEISVYNNRVKYPFVYSR